MARLRIAARAILARLVFANEKACLLDIIIGSQCLEKIMTACANINTINANINTINEFYCSSV